MGGDIELTPKEGDGWARSVTISANTFQPTAVQRESGAYGPIKLNRAMDVLITGNFTTGTTLIHPASGSLGKGVNIISNTLNNPPEIGDLKGAKAGDASAFLGKKSAEDAILDAEQWTVTGPGATVGMHALLGFRFQPTGEGTRSIAYAQAPPQGTAIRHEQGDVLFNSRPSLSAEGKVLLGWVCLYGGAPGAWKPLLVDTK